MANAATLLTANDLLRPPYDDLPHELVRGEIRTVTPAGGRHGAINGRIALRLGHFVDINRLGVVLTENTGFHLARDPDTLRCPDVSFLSRARIPVGGIGPGLVEGAPDLAVEVLSPGDTVYESEEKTEDYLAAGVRMVWVVNPKLQRVTVYGPGQAPRVFGEQDTIEGGDVLPGFACRVGDFFSWPE